MLRSPPLRDYSFSLDRSMRHSGENLGRRQFWGFVKDVLHFLLLWLDLWTNNINSAHEHLKLQKLLTMDISGLTDPTHPASNTIQAIWPTWGGGGQGLLQLSTVCLLSGRVLTYNVVLPPGNYSCLVAQFHMRRSVSFHLIQSYLPSILIVAVSWVSFWMDIESVPGRISLGVITLLAVSSQAGLGNVDL